MKKISYCVFFLCAVTATEAAYSTGELSQQERRKVEESIMKGQGMAKNFQMPLSKPQKEALNDGRKKISMSKEEKERVEQEIMEIQSILRSNSQMTLGQLQVLEKKFPWLKELNDGRRGSYLLQTDKERIEKEIMETQSIIPLSEPQKEELNDGSKEIYLSKEERDSISRVIQILMKQYDNFLVYVNQEERDFTSQIEQLELEIEKNKSKIEENNSEMRKLIERKKLASEQAFMESGTNEKKVDLVKLFNNMAIAEMKELQELNEKMKKQNEDLQEKKDEINKKRFEKCCERKKEIEKKEKWINYFEDKIKGVSEKIQSLPVKGQDVVGQNQPATDGGYNELADLRKKRCELMIKQTILQDEFTRAFNERSEKDDGYEKAKKKYNDSMNALRIKRAKETEGKIWNAAYELKMNNAEEEIGYEFSVEDQRMREKRSKLNRKLDFMCDPKNPDSLCKLREEVNKCKEKIKLLKSKGSHMAKGKQSQEEEKSWR